MGNAAKVSLQYEHYPALSFGCLYTPATLDSDKCDTSVLRHFQRDDVSLARVAFRSQDAADQFDPVESFNVIELTMLDKRGGVRAMTSRPRRRSDRRISS